MEMGTNIRVVIQENEGEGSAVCICGRDFQWSVPRNNNILYKANDKREVDTVICCPRCFSTIKK